MQQAYRILRVVAEAQTIRMVLMLAPGELLLRELHAACSSITRENSAGIKAVVLDFQTQSNGEKTEMATVSADDVHKALLAIRVLPPPVLAVVRGKLSVAASELLSAADLSLVAHDAALMVRSSGNTKHETLSGIEASRLRRVNWSVPAQNIDAEMERILNMLREKSAVALQLAKESVRIATDVTHEGHTDGQGPEIKTRLHALRRVNEFYLSYVMQTADAPEGLHAFLEKRKPHWHNH